VSKGQEMKRVRKRVRIEREREEGGRGRGRGRKTRGSVPMYPFRTIYQGIFQKVKSYPDR